MASHKTSSELINSIKIKKNLVLRLDSKNLNTLNEEVKIISIKCENFEEVEKLLRTLKEENFPKAFIICIEVKNEEKKAIERVKALINEKFSKVRPLLVQINSENFLRKKNENFKQIALNLSEKEIQKSLNDSKFSTEIFLNIQKGSKFFDADFEKILSFQNLKIEEPKLSQNLNEKFKKLLGKKVPKSQKVSSESFQKFYLNAINSQDDFCLRLLKLFDLKLKESQIEIFQSTIRSKNFDIFLAFFDVFEASKVKVEKVQELLTIKNFLLEAVECKNFEVVKFFLNLKLNSSTVNEALEVSIEREYFDIFNVFKNSNADPELIRKGDKILKQIKSLHENIKKENFDDVKKFLEENSSRLCYGDQKVCALELAIDHRKFEIFSFLRAKGFYTDKGSELDDKISKLSETQKLQIRLENLKYVQEFPNALILSKCKFDALSPVSSEVQEMLTDLSRLDELQPFLQIAAQADLKIIFDFATESVKNMDPSADEHVMGLAYFSRGELYVGRDRDRLLRYGTFCHELTHMVLYLVYENACLPYCKGDKVREEMWEQILETERANFTTNQDLVEAIIQWVFICYERGYQQRAELAVRPNHIMARYFDNPEKVQELRESHAELFNYLKNFVLPDVKIPNILRLIKLNNDFEVIERIEGSNLKLKPSNFLEILNDTREKLVLTSNVPKLALSKLFNDIKSSSQNKLDVKVKNIFVDAEKLKSKAFNEELLDLVKNCKIDRIIFDLIDAESEINFDRNLPKGLRKIFICSEENSDKFECEKVMKTFNFNDLTLPCKIRLQRRKIKFQGKSFDALKFLELAADEIFPLLCDEKEISINSRVKFSESYFIPRVIIDSLSNEFELEEFIESVQSEKFVVLSNFAGNGKTCFLIKVYESFIEEFPEHWISFISLIDHVDELSQISSESFEEKFVKISNLTKIEEKVFTQKFAKGEVKILFDGFDEISPKCKEQTLALFRKFKAQDKNQIWITTRTHLEHDLESELHVKAFKLKNLPESDQIEFLRNFWKNSNPDENFVKLCAEQLVEKISEIVSNFPDLIGIPLIIQSVAKLYVSKIDENFPNKIKNLKLSKVYEKIIEEFLNILASRFPQSWSQNAFKSSSILQALKFLTIVHYFDENFANSLGLSIDTLEWSLEEISRVGLVTLMDDKRVKFNHETYGQNFLANVMENILKNYSELSGPQIELLTKILTEDRFKIAKMFLDEMITDSKSKSLNLFKNEENLKIFEFLGEENFTNLFKFLIKSNLNKFPKFEEKIEETLCNASENFESSEVFEQLLREVQKYFDENFFSKFLLSLKSDGSTIFESLTKNLKEKNLETILKIRSERKETILHVALGHPEKFQNVLKAFGKNVNKDVQKDLIRVKNCMGQNILMQSPWRENFMQLILEHAESLMEKSEIEIFLQEPENDLDTVLHTAASSAESKENFEFLWRKILKNVENPKEFLMRKGRFEKNALHGSAQNTDDPQIFAFVFELAKSFCNNEEEVKNLITEKNSKNGNLLTFSAIYLPKANLEFLYEKILEIFSKEEIKNLLKTTKGFQGRNLLSLSTENDRKESIEFLWKFVEENLSPEEIFELLNDKDDVNDNVLHCAAMFASSKEIFEFFWGKISENFDEENLRVYVKLKGLYERNIFMKSIAKANENCFYYIFENILGKLFDFKEIIYELDGGENFLHWLARFGSDSMVEYGFKKLEEKLSLDELKTFLMIKSEKLGFNLLHCAALNAQDLDAIKILAAKLEEILGKEGLKELLNQSDKDKDFPLYCAIACSTSEIFDFYAKLYEENFTKNEIKNILDAKDFKALADVNRVDETVKEKVEKFYQSLCE